MPAKKRYKTKYPGVYYTESISKGSGRPERIFNIVYRKGGKVIEEKAGRQFQDDMTPARAAALRSQKIEGNKPTNKEQRIIAKKRLEENLNRWTVERLWEAYKTSRPGLKGIVTDENRFQNHIKPLFGNKEVEDITSLEIDSFRVKVLKSRSASTVKNILELLRRVINFGVKRNLCSPLSFILELPRTNNLKTEDLSTEDLSKLLEAINNSPNIQAANMMKLALSTGMRRGELFKLKWEDIDFNRGFILLKDPKGGPDQKIPLNDSSREILINHPKTDSPYVFPGRNGNRRTDIKKAVNKIKIDAGLPPEFRALHGLRHVYASMLASSGRVDMYTLQKLLTHKSPVMTQRYAHLRDESLRNASDVANQILNEATNNISQVVKE